MLKTYQLKPIKKMEIPRDSFWTVLKDIGIATLAVVCFLAGFIVVLLNI